MIKLWNQLLSEFVCLELLSQKSHVKSNACVLDWILTLAHFKCSINAAELN